MPAMFFADKQAAITSIAYLYGEAARTSQLGQECLAALEENSGFDRIRFVNLEGESFASDGKIADVADRDYFTRGVQGESGAMIGFLEEETVSDILETDVYGYPAFTMIVDQDGASLGQYLAEGYEKATGFSSLLPYIQEEERKTTRGGAGSSRQLSAFLSLALMAFLPETFSPLPGRTGHWYSFFLPKSRNSLWMR